MLDAAIIGLGNIAWRYDYANQKSKFPLSQAGAIRRHPALNLVAGCSLAVQDCEGFSAWSGCRSFKTAKEMLSVVQPGFVGICSPTEEHFGHARLCMESGVKVIWLEKPPSSTVAELESLLRLSEEYGVTVGVNYFRRYQASYQKLKQLVNTEFGPCRLINILYSPGLLRNGCHLVDIMFFLTGATGYNLLWAYKGTSAASPCFSLSLSTGQTVTVSGADLPYHSNNITMICDGGVASLNCGGLAAEVYIRTPNRDFPGFYTLEHVAQAIPEVSEPGDYMGEGLNDLLRSWQAEVLPASNLHTALLGQRVMEEVLTRAEA